MDLHSSTEIGPVEELRFLRLPEVEYIVGKKRSTIYRDIASGEFPAPYNLGGGRCVAWLSTEIKEWVLNRPRVMLRKKTAQEP